MQFRKLYCFQFTLKKLFIYRRKKKCAGLEDSSESCQGDDNCSNSEDTQEHVEDNEEDVHSPFLNMPPLRNPCLNSQELFLNASSQSSNHTP